jgi:hypothetical protein
VETVTVTATEVVPAGVFAGETLHVLSAGAPLQAMVTWFAKGPPAAVNVNW